MSTVEKAPPQSQPSDRLLEILRCLGCKGQLESDQKGGYVCEGCGRAYKSVQGVARFVEAENYAESFGFQWHRYARTQLDHDEVAESERLFGMKTGFKPEDVKGKLVLDVGCGMGRFAEVATRWGATVVGVDLSAAAEVAAQNLSEHDFVALQADVFALPFAPDSFDIIYSIGVLHHTPDCGKAVKVLPQFLKPAGTLSVWLYSGYNKWYRFSDIWRKYTSRMGAGRLHSMVKLAVPVLYNLDRGLRAVPVIGKPMAGVIHHVFPVSRQSDAEARVLDTFDWYSPRYQSKHTYEQVFRWFEELGMEDLHVGEIPISVRGRKPYFIARADAPCRTSS
jgi:SAM-dependent methyltransferase